MEYAAGPPNRWIVTLRSGDVVELAADGFSTVDGVHLFTFLAQTTPAEQADVRVLATTPADPEVVMVLAASIPAHAVANIEGGSSWRAVQQRSTATNEAKDDHEQPQQPA